MQLHERSFGGFRLSPKPPTLWDEGSSSRCSPIKREAQSCHPISTAVQQYSLTPFASRKSAKTIKSTRLTIRRKTRRFQTKNKSSRKGPFSTGGIRLQKKWPYNRVAVSYSSKSDFFFWWGTQCLWKYIFLRFCVFYLGCGSADVRVAFSVLFFFHQNRFLGWGTDISGMFLCFFVLFFFRFFMSRPWHC